jgi:hypothetical protein
LGLGLHRNNPQQNNNPEIFFHINLIAVCST